MSIFKKEVVETIIYDENGNVVAQFDPRIARSNAQSLDDFNRIVVEGRLNDADLPATFSGRQLPDVSLEQREEIKTAAARLAFGEKRITRSQLEEQILPRSGSGISKFVLERFGKKGRKDHSLIHRRIRRRLQGINETGPKIARGLQAELDFGEKLSDPTGQIIDRLFVLAGGQITRYLQEVEFNIPVRTKKGKTVFVSRADAVVTTPSGLMVVDYKTGSEFNQEKKLFYLVVMGILASSWLAEGKPRLRWDEESAIVKAKGSFLGERFDAKKAKVALIWPSGTVSNESFGMTHSEFVRAQSALNNWLLWMALQK